MILQLLANGLAMGAVYSMVALGYGMIYNTSKIFHIAHGAVYTVAAYVFYLFYRPLGFPLLVSLLLGLTAGVIVGLLTEILIYRPLLRRQASAGVTFVSSLGAYVLIVNLVALIFGNETKVLFPGIGKTHHLGSVTLTKIQIIEFLASMFVIACIFLVLRKTVFGKLVRGLADNSTLLSLLGIEASTLRMVVFGVGSLLAGISSCLVAIDVGVDPNVGMQALLVSVVAVIIGGVGLFESAALGAFIIGILQNVAVWKMSARWQDAVTFSLLIVFLLMRPQGILGKRRRTEES